MGNKMKRHAWSAYLNPRDNHELAAFAFGTYRDSSPSR